MTAAAFPFLLMMLAPDMAFAADFASVMAVSGRVRLRSATSIDWMPVLPRQTLRKGDLVWIDEQANLTVWFNSTATMVFVEANTLLPVEALLPRPSRFRRATPPSASQGEGKEVRQSEIAAAPRGETMEARTTLTGGGKRFAAYRRLSRTGILFPMGELTLRAEKYPARTAVTLDSPGTQTYEGRLWDANSGEVVWWGESRRTFTKIRVPRPGTYKFQATAADGSAATEEITIAAARPDGPILAENWKDGRIEVFP